MLKSRHSGLGSLALKLGLLCAIATNVHCFMSVPQPLAGLRQPVALRRARVPESRMAAISEAECDRAKDVASDAKPAGFRKTKLPGIVSALIVAIMSVRGPAMSGPRNVNALEPAGARSASVVDNAQEQAEVAFSTRCGQVRMVADAKKAAEPNVMLSFKTVEQKQLMTMLVSGAYVCVWAFFYFTHDAGEASE